MNIALIKLIQKTCKSMTFRLWLSLLDMSRNCQDLCGKNNFLDIVAATGIIAFHKYILFY